LYGGVLESGCRLEAALDFDGGGEWTAGILPRLGHGEAFQILITLLQNLDDLGSNDFARLGRQFLHYIPQRQSAPVLAIGTRGRPDSPRRRECALHRDLRSFNPMG